MDNRFQKMNNVVEHYEDDEIPADWEFPNLPTAKKLDDEIVVTLKHVQKGISINSIKRKRDLIFQFSRSYFNHFIAKNCA